MSPSIVADQSWIDEPATYEAVCIAASAGGIPALREILFGLPTELPVPVFVAQHRALTDNKSFVGVLQFSSKMPVVVAAQDCLSAKGTVYVAPGGRHLEFNADGTFDVSREGKVGHVIPSADLLFQSVARIYGKKALAIVLTGTGSDGAAGVVAVRQRGGFVMAQDEESSAYFDMPLAAIETFKVDIVLSIEQMSFAIRTLVGVPDVPMRNRTRRVADPLGLAGYRKADNKT